ncbi:prolyl 4-hydroxylase subunit alpha-3 isoform X2 [Poecilia formosa]|uniref:prolyl 4-hydroxylase subunit alpha-3 isoform X2 n=1 Tax=Poecilia formosa TaxID=48698 RepID=UPI0007BA8A26|nr:PREDICTED: prolyl 4-hydroxylase subunit alpha-3 isoform X2 [Poecilia formosa]
MEAPPAAFCLCCFLVAALAFQAEGEMYTSLQNVRQAIDVERKLIDYLRMYIDSEQQRLEDIKRFHARVSDLHSELYKGPAAATANPLVAFTLVKRLHSEWLNVVYSNEAQENVQNLRSRYKEEEAHLPKVEDLRGAAKGLMRLQDVYSLQVSSLVEGRFQRASGGGVIDVCSPAVSVSLSGDDCFLVGKVAYEQEDYYHSVQWLEESVRLFRGAAGEWSPENEGTLEDALDHLAFSHFKTGNVSYALSLSHELLHHDPMNGRVLQNIEKYEKLLGSAGPTGERSLRRPGSSSLTTRDTYERLCLTQGSQPMHFENPGLFCDLFTNNHSPALLLQPVRREVLSLQPHVELYHNFITDAEADDIKRLAQPGVVEEIRGGSWRKARNSRLSNQQECVAERLGELHRWEVGPKDFRGNGFERDAPVRRVPSGGELWDWWTL